MTMFRAFWGLLAAVGVGLAIWAGTWPVEPCGPDGVGRCSESVGYALGVWHVISLGALFSAPAIIAAAAMRWWVSGVAVLAYAAMSLAGVVNWSNHWVTLLCAAPLMLLAILFAALQLLTASDDPRPVSLSR